VSEHVIIREIDRADHAVIAGLATAGVATVYEAQGRRGLLDAEIRPIQRGARIGGSAVTVSSAPGDNLMVHAAIEVLRDGDLLVVALTEPALYGMVGDLLATSMRAHGCVGLVIDSAVRDTAELNEMGFPVWSRGIYCAGTAKETAGSVNVPVVAAGAAVSPGDVIVADDDGVVVVPRDAAASVLEATQQRLDKEAATRTRLEAGELGVDFYGLRDTLSDLGVQYRDDT
jgi:4-hydroxy-4-methyl-2-oxoglutarate aldolase